MAMQKNLDERARKKEFYELFLKFDQNKNVCNNINIMQHLYWIIVLGKIYVKDFVREMKIQGVKICDADLEHICKITDKSGQVKLKV